MKPIYLPPKARPPAARLVTFSRTTFSLAHRRMVSTSHCGRFEIVETLAGNTPLWTVIELRVEQGELLRTVLLVDRSAQLVMDRLDAVERDRLAVAA